MFPHVPPPPNQCQLLSPGKKSPVAPERPADLLPPTSDVGPEPSWPGFGSRSANLFFFCIRCQVALMFEVAGTRTVPPFEAIAYRAAEACGPLPLVLAVAGGILADADGRPTLSGPLANNVHFSRRSRFVFLNLFSQTLIMLCFSFDVSGENKSFLFLSHLP